MAERRSTERRSTERRLRREQHLGLLREETERSVQHRRAISDLLTQQLQVERLTGEVSSLVRSLTAGVAYALTRRDRPIPEVGLVVPRQYENRRTAPYPTQLTYEPLSGPMAPSSYIQELIILELGQIGVSVLELVAEL